jgi:hypothetical protein
MTLRLRSLVALACIGLGASGAACSGATTPGEGSTPPPAVVTGEYQGELSGANETGVLVVTIESNTTAPARARWLDVPSLETALGTLTLSGGVTVDLSGTFDPSSGALSLSGGGYAFAGSITNGSLGGSYTGPNGSGSFSLVPGGASQFFCGSFDGSDSGVWNLVVGASSAAGSLASASGAVPFTCTVSGATLSCSGANGVVATGSIAGGVASGDWHDGKGGNGKWKGTSGGCPSPTPEDAGHDAAPAVDASTEIDAATTEDAGVVVTEDASTGVDAGGGGDSSVEVDATTGDDAGVEDAGTTSTDAGTTATDAGANLDAGSSTGSDAGGSDAGASADSGPTDAGAPTDAASFDASSECPYVADVSSVIQGVAGPSPQPIGSLGVGTGDYPIQLLANAAVCPGVSVAQIGANGAWTTIGTCGGGGNGTGPITTCSGVAIPATNLTMPGQFQLRVMNPGQASGTTYSFAIFQGDPSPVVTGPLNVPILHAGGGAQQITLTGTGFVPGTTTADCEWVGDGGAAVTPTLSNVTSTSMTLTFPASFTATSQPLFWTRARTAAQPGGVSYWARTIAVQ